MCGGSLGYTRGMFLPKLAVIVLMDLTDGDIWWVETQPSKKQKKKTKKTQQCMSWTWKTPAFPHNRCFPQMSFSIRAGTFGSTGFMLNFVTKNWTGLQKHTAHGDCSAVAFQCFWESPHNSVALFEVQVSQNGSGTAGGQVTFWSGSSS